MANEGIRLSNPPAKPLVIWDGDCHFCRRWTERWRAITGDAADYQTSQAVADRFPAISPERFQTSVVYIRPSGEVFFGAAAVFHALECRASRKWLSWSYDHIAGFAAITEAAYAVVARNRGVFSVLTHWLWGN